MFIAYVNVAVAADPAAESTLKATKWKLGMQRCGQRSKQDPGRYKQYMENQKQLKKKQSDKNVHESWIKWSWMLLCG